MNNPANALLPGQQSDYIITWTPSGISVVGNGSSLLFGYNDVLQFGDTFHCLDLSTIQQPNTPPVAVDDPDSGTFQVDENSVLIIPKATLLANDFDDDGDALTITDVRNAINGTVDMDDTNVIFMPATDYSGAAQFIYDITDGTDTDSALVSITVNQVIPPNQPPVAIDDGVYQVTEGETIDISQLELMSNDFDPDNDAITFVDAFNAVNGTVAVVGQDVAFTADQGLGAASFEYSITDGEDTDTATVTLNVNPAQTSCNPDPDGYVAAIMAEPELSDMPAMLALVPRSDANCVAICDGNWSDPDIWWNGAIPGADDKVLIPHDRVVDYDYFNDFEGIKTIRIDGVLSFSGTENTYLVVDTFIVTSAGSVYSDTPAGVTTTIEIADNGPIDTGWDPTLLSRGVLSHGTAHLKGACKTEFCKPANIPMAGDMALVFYTAPMGWEVGDRLVLTGTHWQHQFNNVDSEDEEITITAIDGSTIEFTPALAHNHDVPREDLSPYVANLTRNVRIVGPDTTPSERGHVMFMHNNDVDIRYVEFADLGRTDKSVPAFDGGPNQSPTDNIKGRYSFHFHKIMGGYPENPAIAIGNSVHGNPGWGFVHHSGHANFSRNVFYDGVGAGFAAEDGDETGIWYQNLAIKVAKLKGYGSAVEKFISDLERDDMGRFGEGFFMHGRLVEIAENVAASCTHGFCWQHRGPVTNPLEEHLHQPEISWGQSRVPVRQTVIQGMRDNEAFCCAQGLLILKSGPQQEHEVRSVFGPFLAWECYFGFEISYTGHYTMVDWDTIGTNNPYKNIKARNELGSNAYDMTWVRLKATNFGAGFDWADSWAGMSAPPDNEVSINLIDPELTGNDVDLGSHDPNRLRVIDSADLNPGTLTDNFGPTSWTLGDDYFISGDKTDSIGTIPRPVGASMHGVPAWRISDWVNKFGYYTLPTGEFVMVFEDYIADRATGELHKKGEIITLNVSQSKLNQWGTPYHGEITPGGAMPDAQDDTATTSKNSWVAIPVLANDSDPDGGMLRISGITNPKHGDAWEDFDGVIMYRPNLDFTGMDEFRYWARDERGNLSPATVTVTVT